MVKSKTYKKNIVCLEALWDQDVENRLTVLPILELTAKASRVKTIFMTCNTLAELEHNLKIARRMRGYGILYFAFHGSPGKIHLDGSTVELELLSFFMEKHFKNWIVHFDSCAALRVKKSRIRRFLDETGILMLTGYKRRVDWMESAALGLLFLDWIQRYKNMRIFWERFRNTYTTLTRSTGIRAFYRDL